MIASNLQIASLLNDRGHKMFTVALSSVERIS